MCEWRLSKPMSSSEGAVVEASDAAEYAYSYGGTGAVVEDGGWETSNDGAYSYGYDGGATSQSQEGGSWSKDPASEDAAWTQGSVGTETETALEEWQWVQDPASGGYYYNSVTGEARWDDQAAVDEANSQALVEHGYQHALAQSTAGSYEATAADQAAQTEYYGEESYVFTADDGTVWRYDTAAGDYVQQQEEEEQQQEQEEELSHTAEGESIQLDSSAGSPWQRVDTEQGPYYFNTHTQETSWDPPQEGGDNAEVPRSWEAGTELQYGGTNDGDALQQSDGSGLNVVTDAVAGTEHQYDGMNDGGALQQSDEFGLDVVTDAIAGTERQYDGTDDGDALQQSDGSGLNVVTDAIEGESSASVVSTHGSGAPVAPAPERISEGDESKALGGSVDVKSNGGRSEGGDSGDGDGGKCRGRASTGVVSEWSSEKLRVVSKTIPGEWLVSDFLLERATEDYDRMVELDDSEIEAIKSKGTSRIIRSLVGPEEGEDDEEDELSLPSGDESGEESDRVLASTGPAEVGGRVLDERPMATAVPSVKSEEILMENLGGGEGQRGNRRRSILGLKQASAGSKEGLGAWKPGFAMDGSAYFVHQETGESAWTYPVRAWEVKANQLGLLTPRTPLEVGRGVCRLRETEAMRKKRVSYRWKVEQQREKEAVRRREDPTPAEAAETAVEGIIATIERRERRERRLVEHNARVEERARWHPSAGEYLMQRLVVSSPSAPAASAAGVTSSEIEQGVNKIISDADFVDVKLTQTSSFANLRFELPAMIHEGLAHAPSLPRLPSVKTLARVRSLDDLKRELNAGFSSSVGGIKQGKSSAVKVFQSKIDGRGKGVLKATVEAEQKAVADAAGEQSTPADLAASLKSVAFTGLSPRLASSGAPVGDAAAESMSPAVVASEGQEEEEKEETIQASTTKEEDTPGSDNVSVNTRISPSTEAAAAAAATTTVARGGQDEAGTTPRPSTATTPRTPPPQVREATAAAGLKSEQGHAVSNKKDGNILGGEPPSPIHPRASKGSPRISKSAAASRGPAMNAERVQAMHDDKRGGRDKLGRPDAPSDSVALAAVASLDEQVRGLGGKLALRIEGGDSANSRARTGVIGAEALAAAKTSLVRVGKAIGLRRKSQRAPAPTVRNSAKVPPPPPDTATVTLRLACKPPPFNLLTTIRVKDPATGKSRDHEVLTSVLRDAWEKIIVRDVATAGGVEARQASPRMQNIGQVLIEEVRRGGGPFPLEVSRRREEARFYIMGGTLPDRSDSALPFRPERCDDTYRKLSRKRPTALSEGLLSRSVPQLEVEAGTFSDAGQRSTEANGKSMRKSGFLKQPLASSAPLPSAGVRAVLTRRLLSGPRIKRRRWGNGVGHRGGSQAESGGGGGNPVFNRTNEGEMGNKNKLSTALTTRPPSALRYGRQVRDPSSDAFSGIDMAAAADTPTPASTWVAPTPTQDEQKSVVGPEEILQQQQQQQGANEIMSGTGGRSKGDHIPPPGKINTDPPSSPTGVRPLTAPDSVATTAAALKKPAPNSGGPPPQTAKGHFPIATSVSNEKNTPPRQRERADPAGALGLGDIYDDCGGVDREALTGGISTGGEEVVKMRINFADKTTADGIAVGIGAGNRDDWGILGRVTKKGGHVLRSLRHVEGMIFEAVDDGRKQDPAVQEAIQDTLRGNRFMKTWQAKDSVMKAMDHRERIPTLHELKLAGRVERARALFGPGGYLPRTLTAEAAREIQYESTAVAGAEHSPALRRPEGVERPQDNTDVLFSKARDDNRDRRVSVTSPHGDHTKKEGDGSSVTDDEDDKAKAQLTPALFVPSRRESIATREALMRAAPEPPPSNATGNEITTVTLTIVGGGTGCRSFAYRPQGSKTPSEAVARLIALQAGAEGSDLLRGGLTHTTLSAHWRPAGRGRVMSTWEGYWCHIISPAFFGRSVRSRHMTKTEARRRREDAARQQQKEDFLASEEEEKLETALADKTTPLPSRRFMSLNEQLEHAELQYQDLLAEGTADGRRLNPKQYMAMKTRDRTIKKVLLRRKIKAKQKSGGLTRTRFPYRRLPSDEVNCWNEEIVAEDQEHRAERRKQNAARRQERAEDSRKRGERNKLKTWILRHLVTSSGDPDLMAKAIALHHEGENMNGVGSASKGAIGLESFISGRNMRPGGRFLYGLETSAQDMKNKDITIKAQRKFEQDTDSLLREIFRVVDSAWHASLSPPSTPGSVTAGVDKHSGPSRFLPINSASKKNDPPATVPEKGREGTVEADGGGGGSFDGTAHIGHARSSRNRSVLSSQTDTATAGGNSEASPPEGSRTGTAPACRTASAVTPVPAAIDSSTSHDALVLAQDKAVGNSTLVTSPVKSLAREERGIAGGDMGGGRGEGGRGAMRAEEEEDDNQNSVRKEEVVSSVPRSELLRALRQSGLLRRKAMTSDAVRPILCDRDFTEALLLHPCAESGSITENELALFGSVTAEVDRWYKRVRATLDPVRAVSEARVKSFETRKERGRNAKAARERDKADGLAPSDAWRRQLNVSRKTNRGDGRAWSRFHHHVLIRTAPHLPLYCCLCRRRKWDEARVARLKAEHAVRASWGRVLSERQEILEPMVQAEVRAALNVDGALRDRNEGAWAAMHCLNSLVIAVPGRMESFEAAGDIVEIIMERVMRESCSFEERTRKRRAAALAKLRALEGLQTTGTRGRRRSRRVSVGPTGFAVTPAGGVIVSSPVPKRGASVPGLGIKLRGIGTVSEVTESVAGATGVGTENAGATGRQGDDRKASFAVPGGLRRGFAEFSEQAQVTARGYYSAPQGALGADVRGTAAWDRLTEAWFQAQPAQGDVWEDERLFALEACVVEVLEGERRKWERCEWERRAMFAEDELQRRSDESLRRSAEAAPRERQEAGQRAFCAVLDTMERRLQSLARLRWEFIAEFQDMQNMTCRVRDAATGKRYVCRLLPCRGPEEVADLLREAYRIQEIRNPSLVKVHSAHPHRIATYDERGVQTTGGEVVLVLLEFCPGGSIEDHLGQLRGVTETMTFRAGGDRDHGRPRTNRGSLGPPAVGPKTDKQITTGAYSASRVENGEMSKLEKGSITSDACERKAGVMDGGGTIDLRVTARRLEIWVRQVAHGLSALHADGGIHRNINAGNVYLDEKRRAKLGGYQCLKAPSQPQASPGQPCISEGFGSVTTAPPEFELCGETSAKGDMWSLGCALFKWTTGKEFAYLAAGARLQDMLHLVPPSFGNKIKTALVMCLQRDPGVRVSSIDLWKFMSAAGDNHTASLPPTAAVAQ